MRDPHTDPEAPARTSRPGFQRGNTLGKATQFQPGNLSQYKTGAYASLITARDRKREALLQQAGVLTSIVEDAREITDDLASRQGFAVTPLQARLARRFAEVDGLAMHLSRILAEAGPVTHSGKTRACFEKFIKCVTVQAKIASALGLPKPSALPASRGTLLPTLANYRPADEGQP
jgi:hypothetical protein